MRYTLTILLTFTCFLVQSQTLGFTPGFNYGRYYNAHKTEGQSKSAYEGQLGYSFRVELKDLPIDSGIHIAFALSYQHYGGRFNTQNVGLGGAAYEKGELSKHSLGFEFYPLHLKIKDQLRLNMGVACYRMLAYSISGTRYWWSGTANDPSYKSGFIQLKDDPDFVNPFSIGVIGSVGYEMKIGKLILEPRYRFYLGLTDEVQPLTAATRALRNSFELSFGFAF